MSRGFPISSLCHRTACGDDALVLVSGNLDLDGRFDRETPIL